MKFEEFWKRIEDVINIKTQGELADILGIRQATVSDAKKRNSVPAEWLMKLYLSHGLNPVWLAYGHGQKYISQEKYKLSEVTEKELKYGSAEADIDMLAQLIEDMEKNILQIKSILPKPARGRE